MEEIYGKGYDYTRSRYEREDKNLGPNVHTGGGYWFKGGALVWGSEVAKEKLNGDVRGHCYGGGTLGLK